MNKICNYEKEITIIIFTFNRYLFLKRLLNFYDQYEEKFSFLILDSSNVEFDKELLKFTDRPNVQYLKFNSTIFFSNKIARGSANISTPFSVLCADDDFLIPSGITKSLKFLKNNRNYASAHGLYFNHLDLKTSVKVGFGLVPLYEKGRSSDEDSALDRLNAYLSMQTAYYPMYAVHRTTDFKKIWTQTERHVSDWGLSELFPCSLSLIYGKMKVLPIFYSSREPNTFQPFKKQDKLKWYTPNKIKNATFGLAIHLANKDCVSLPEAKLAIKSAFERYLYLNYLRERNIFDSLKKLIARIDFRRRFRQFLNIPLGCHNSIYEKNLKDYYNVKKSVYGTEDLSRELISSRQTYKKESS